MLDTLPAIGVRAPGEREPTPIAASVEEAVRVRAHAEHARATATLRSLGAELGPKVGRRPGPPPHWMVTGEDREPAPT
jgi:hypothetical protein